MTALWPWLAVAGVGALHGLNPATGWMLAAAQAARSGDRSQALRALLPIAAGHLASIAAVAVAASRGMVMDRAALLAGAALWVVVAALRLQAGRAGCPARRRPGGRTGLALSSFIASTAHGAGLMLVPALIPLCLGASPARALTASGSWSLALAAVAVHAVAMLAVTGAVALAACIGFDACVRWRRRRRGGRDAFAHRRSRRSAQCGRS